MSCGNSCNKEVETICHCKEKGSNQGLGFVTAIVLFILLAIIIGSKRC